LHRPSIPAWTGGTCWRIRRRASPRARPSRRRVIRQCRATQRSGSFQRRSRAPMARALLQSRTVTCG